MKSYTDIEQSKKLAEVISPESADYCWGIDNETLHYNNSPYPCAWKDYSCKEYYIPCWSLAALLDILSKTAHSIDEDGSVDLGDYKNIEWSVCLNNTNVGLFTSNNPVDACCQMIVKLHELKML